MIRAGVIRHHRRRSKLSSQTTMDILKPHPKNSFSFKCFKMILANHKRKNIYKMVVKKNNIVRVQGKTDKLKTP